MKVKHIVYSTLLGFVAISWQTLQEISWIEPGRGGNLPAEMDIPNPQGKLGYVYADGEISMKNHAFFEPLGSNGRACVTCHQPKDAMSVSVESLQKRWTETNGKDPIFAGVDGSNNPKLPQELESSHSLLLKRG